jgi:hypothetical protein
MTKLLTIQLQTSTIGSITTPNTQFFTLPDPPPGPLLLADPQFASVQALLPLKTNVFGVVNNLHAFDTTATIASAPLDPFGNPGVLVFSGSDRLKLPAATLTKIGDQTIELWFKPLVFVETNLIDCRSLSTDTSEHAIGLETNGASGIRWPNPNQGYLSTVANLVLLNQWNYLNVSINTSINQFSYWLNGNLVKFTNGDRLSRSTTDWYFGGFRPAVGYSYGSFNGYMSNIRISSIWRDGSVVPTAPFPTF